MLIAAFLALSVTVLLGLFLAGTTPADRGDFAYWPWAHGLMGGIGLVVLLAAWWRATLTGAFAVDAVALIAGALLLGLTVAVLTWRGRRPGMAVIVIHAAFGGIGYLIVAGFAFG